MKLKKGDKIIVIAGKSRGEKGTILRTFPKKSMVLLEGLNMVKRHRRAGQPGKGQIIDKAMPLAVFCFFRCQHTNYLLSLSAKISPR